MLMPLRKVAQVASFCLLSEALIRDLTDQKIYYSEPGTKLFKSPLNYKKIDQVSLNSPLQERSQNLLALLEQALLEESVDSSCLMYLMDEIPDEEIRQRAYQRAIESVGLERLNGNRPSQR